MFLKNIKLTNFRNYSSLNFKFQTPVTVLVGDNAQGKSNFLDSIYFLATSKSSKADKDEELVKQGEEVSRVEGKVVTSGKSLESSEETSLEIAMQIIPEKGLAKRVKVNGIPKRVIDYSSNLAVILFSPEDLNLVIGAPSIRRSHIDQVISQVDKSYKKTLSLYEEVIVRKNRVLKAVKEGRSKINELTYWTDQQILLGNCLQEKRQQFFDYINNTEKKFGNFNYEYNQNLITKHRLDEYQQREIESTNSLIGPHRDDFIFKLDNLDLSHFGSRGEQRTAVLDLKLAEVSFIEQTLGIRPILLLDDIFSELDISHRQHVVDISKLQQTIIAAVELDSYLRKHLKEAQIITVEKGKFNLSSENVKQV